MSDKEYERFMDFLKKRQEEAKRMTKEEALAHLMRCGHLDKDGNFTEPYKHLAAVVKSI